MLTAIAVCAMMVKERNNKGKNKMTISSIINSSIFNSRQELQMQHRIVTCVSDNVCYVMGFEDGYLDFTVPKGHSLRDVIDGLVNVTVEPSDEDNTLSNEGQEEAIRFFKEALIEFAKKN